MVQIARRRKKGRPSKADLARRSGQSPAAASQPDSRRSLRRRSVRYNIIDYDGDYLSDEEDERRREKKKLKLMAKLNQDGEEEEEREEEEEIETTPSRTRAEPVEEYDDDEKEQEEENENEQEEENEEDKDSVVKGRKVESKGLHSVPVSGAPVILQSGIPLPDKRTLELILDKLHKKDTYGVFADPVDPEELPDYHDVIKHPMDFATVRKKLGNESSYTTLEQFEVYKQGPKTRASVAGVTSINLAEYVPAAVDKETEIVVPLNVPGTNDITNLSLFWHKIQNITTSPSFVPEFEENSFTVGSWEQKEVISRDGQMKLHKYIFYEHA